jgi:hypothetical protein
MFLFLFFLGLWEPIYDCPISRIEWSMEACYHDDCPFSQFPSACIIASASLELGQAGSIMLISHSYEFRRRWDIRQTNSLSEQNCSCNSFRFNKKPPWSLMVLIWQMDPFLCCYQWFYILCDLTGYRHVFFSRVPTGVPTSSFLAPCAISNLYIAFRI